MSNRTCTNCGKIEPNGFDRQWWHLRNYFGISGFFCPECYELVSHGRNCIPAHPEQYKAILVKQNLERSVDNKSTI